MLEQFLRASHTYFKIAFVRVMPVAFALIFAAAKIVEQTELLDASNNAWIHRLAELSATALSVEILAFLILEYIGALIPTRNALKNIVLPILTELQNRTTHLEKVANQEVLERLLTEQTANIVSRLKQPSMVIVNQTPEETYTDVVKTVRLITRQKPDQKKLMLHGFFHAAQAKYTESQTDDLPQYFRDFKEEMKRCVESSGIGQWEVRNFYNIASSERLDEVKSRLGWGSEGYEVRAVCMKNAIPMFSPLLLDESDVFLAIFEATNKRVGPSIHIHGHEAAKFFREYYEALWNFDVPVEDDGGSRPVYKLRRENGVDLAEIDRLRKRLSKRTSRAMGR